MPRYLDSTLRVEKSGAKHRGGESRSYPCRIALLINCVGCVPVRGK
jgi:hypothetical protein